MGQWLLLGAVEAMLLYVSTCDGGRHFDPEMGPSLLDEVVK